MGSSSSALLTNEAHPCAKFNKSASLPVAALPLQPFFLHAGLSPPLLLHSSSPLSNGNGTEPCWSSSARSELSLLRREFMDCHAVFLRFGPAGTENFSLWPKSFWPQSQQLTAIHHGSLAFVIMHNGTKSSSSALPAPPTPPKKRYVGEVAWPLHA